MRLSDLQACHEGAYRVVVSNAVEVVERWVGQVALWPKLRVRLAEDAVVLEWPADAAGYELEVTDRIESGLWAPVSGWAPEVAGDRKRITLDPPDSPLFFRLRKP